MKFITTSNALYKQLQAIAGIVTSNSVLSVLEDFHFELKGNILTLTATDLETMMRVQLEVSDAQDDGRICIPSKILLEYLKNLADQPIAFTISQKDLSVEMSSSVGKYRIGGENPDDFPKEAPANDTTTITMPSVQFLEAIGNATFCCSTDTLRPAMTGVFFELSASNINFVATDAHRLVQFRRNDVVCPKVDGFVVPKKPLQQLRSTLPADETPLKISYNDNHLFIETGNLSMSCRLIDARFPDYKAVVPADSPYRLMFNRTELQGALRRISIFANKTTNQVVLDINGNSLQLSAQDLDFSYEGKETLSCNYTGEDMKIAFNARILVELLNNLPGSDVTMELTAPTRAAILRPSVKEEGTDLMQLIMPLMVGA